MGRKTGAAKGGGKSGGKAGKGFVLPPEDEEEWADAMRDVKPLPARPAPQVSKRATKIAVPRPKKGQDRTPPPRPARTVADNPSEKPISKPGLDRGTDDRLRRGQLPVEGRLDLHGLTQAQAMRALDDFLQRSYERGKRCVLIITGKGARKTAPDTPWFEPQPAVLRERVPEWLREGKNAGMVLRFYPAQPQHGGNGALYVLLRRRREI